MFELRQVKTRIGTAVVVVLLAAGAAPNPASSAMPTCAASTATDAVRDAALTRVGIFAGIEESEQSSTAPR
jgi:hypothetical protein